MRTTLAVALSLLAPFALAADAKKGGVKSVEAAFVPADAKPGQTVTLKLTVTLEDGYYTYPLVQTDKAAAGMVNKVEFPKAGAVVFVGDPLDPANPKSKAEPALGITEMLYYPGTAVYERKAVVSPKAAAGEQAVKIPNFTLTVCDKDNCFPPKAVPVEATFKVLPGPAEAVEPMYAAEVQKALEKK